VKGGGIFLQRGGDNTKIINNIITECIRGITSWSGYSEILNNDLYGNHWNYSGIPDHTGINGNISTNPTFVNTTAGDYHLLEDSPCIDAGDPNDIPGPNETDLDGNPRVFGGRIDMGAYEFVPAIDAIIDIRPETLNLASRGKWISCKIWLPEDYNVADVNSSSVFLEDEVQADWLWFNEKQNVVMAKFARSELVGILELGEVELTVTGYLMDGSYFVGTDSIKVIDKGRLRGRRVNSNSKVVDGIEYYIQTDKSLYRLGEHVEMLYRVTNLGDEDVTFSSLPLPEWNFWVEKDGEYIWRAVNVWWGTITEFTLSPGESREFPAHDHPRIWNMRDKENNLVNVGKYSVIGGLYEGSGYYDHTKVSVPIRIIPNR